jgi:hypothetical protein
MPKPELTGFKETSLSLDREPGNPSKLGMVNPVMG